MLAQPAGAFSRPSVAPFLPARQRQRPPRPRTVAVRSSAQEFGARDPFEGELASNFGDKSLGYGDTDHIIRGPEGLKKVIGLATKSCRAKNGGTLQSLNNHQINVLRNQVPGWRVTGSDSSVSLQQDWPVKSYAAGIELMQRVGQIAEAEGHHPDMHFEGGNKVRMALASHEAGGLTENDFILAAKVNELQVKDLMPKRQRFWA